MKIAISAGEVSGDEHAAKLVLALQALIPGAEIRGMGGRHLRAAGAKTVVDSEASASAMGLFDVLINLRKISAALREMKQLLREWKPDILIVVDFPDFNFRLTKYAKSLGIKVLYFIIPKMWVWRTGRIEHFKRFIDHAAVIFPFEREFCWSRGYPNASYVGHPFDAEWRILPGLNRENFLSRLDLSEKDPVIALMPGSRRGEIKRHLKPLLEAFELVAKKSPNIQGILPLPGTIDAAKIREEIPANLKIRVIEGNSLDVLRVADAGLIKSGTSNLQASFCELPFIMFYQASKLTELIVKPLLKTKYYSIVNILRPDTVLELIQDDVNGAKMGAELEALLNSKQKLSDLKAKLRETNNLLRSFDQFPGFEGTENAYQRTAIIAQKLCSPE